MPDMASSSERMYMKSPTWRYSIRRSASARSSRSSGLMSLWGRFSNIEPRSMIIPNRLPDSAEAPWMSNSRSPKKGKSSMT